MENNSVENSAWKNLLKKFNNQRKYGQFCDLTLKANDNKLFFVHRNILSARCVFFERLFIFEFRNKKEYETFELPISSYALENIIKYIYGEDITIPFGKAREISDAALHLGVNDLVDNCVQFMVWSYISNNTAKNHIAKLKSIYHSAIRMAIGARKSTTIINLKWMEKCFEIGGFLSSC